MTVHRAHIDMLGGRHYAYCLPCEWSGPFRRWKWQSSRDARRHAVKLP